MDAAIVLLLAAAAAAAALVLVLARRHRRRPPATGDHPSGARPAGPGAEGMNPVERGRIAPGPYGGDSP